MASLSISPFNPPLSTNDLYTKYINDSSVTAVKKNLTNTKKPDKLEKFFVK
jgi:hypothetical protein